jgi:hypothetical protein
MEEGNIMTEKKPCPHCGSTNIISWHWLSPYHTDKKSAYSGNYINPYDHNKMYADIACHDCHFGTSNGEFSEIAIKENKNQTWKEAREIAGLKAEEKAIEAWNKRI